MADKASDTANSGRVLRRSPRLNKKASSVQFRTDNPDNSKVHTTTNGEPTTNKRGGTPYKPSLGSTLNAKADSAVNVGVKSQSKPVQNKTDILSSASIISETSRPISRDCSSKNKNNTPVFKRVDPRLALSPPPNMTKSSSPDSHKSSKDSNFATQLPKPSQKCEMEPGAAPERHVTFSAEVVFAAKRSSSIVMRKNTPHKRNNKISTTVRSTTINRTRVMTPARTFAATPGTILSGRKTSKLLQTGAVRMNVAYYTNPKRKVGCVAIVPRLNLLFVVYHYSHVYIWKRRGTRLLDSGAVRKVVSRYTTPRKLVGNRDMW